jgi:hypothetical protein
MAREKQFYREVLLSLNERFPDHDMLSYSEVMQVTGLSLNTVKRHLRTQFNKAKRIHKTSLAGWMCGQ